MIESSGTALNEEAYWKFVGYGGMIENVGNKCYGCSSCANICPQRCISMEYNDEGFLYPVVLKRSCVLCDLCVKACPILNADSDDPESFNEAWGVVSRDQEILLNSSSGGLFSFLSEVILLEDGCVFGAAFSEDFLSVRHIMIENFESLSLLRGSKYIQSEMGNCYQIVKEQLKKGRRVLFSGTPCQVAGLKCFLGQENDLLLCVDLICHGTPSAKLWQEYLHHIEKIMKGIVKSVNFRHKENGWRKFGLEVTMNGDVRYYNAVQSDPYMKLFLKNYCLRESCYQCKVKEVSSGADITIGDFWGVDKVVPDIDSFLGVSLAILHTEKGKAIFEKCKPYMTAIRVDYEKATTNNSTIKKSVARPVERNCFFSDLIRLKWDKLEHKYNKEKMSTVIKRKLSSTKLGKFLKQKYVKL